MSSSLSLAELKNLCRTAGVPITGNKAQLNAYLANPAAHQKGKRKAAGQGAGAGRSHASAPKLYAGAASSPAALAAVPPEVLARIASASRELKGHVASLAHHVDSNWHDCYEETDEELAEYAILCREVAAAALHAALVYGAGFDQGHQVLVAVADSWDDIHCIPFRGCPDESLGSTGPAEAELFYLSGKSGGGTAEVELGDPLDVVQFAWPLLLAKAAGDATVPDATLARLVKDAVDHGCDAPHEASATEAALDDGVVVGHDAGRARLAALFGRPAEWSSLATTKKAHKMRRGIDRRFDGPKNRRTRDFLDDEEGDY